MGKQIGKPTKLSNNGKEKPANGKGDERTFVERS